MLFVRPVRTEKRKKKRREERGKKIHMSACFVAIFDDVWSFIAMQIMAHPKRFQAGFGIHIIEHEG